MTDNTADHTVDDQASEQVKTQAEGQVTEVNQLHEQFKELQGKFADLQAEKERILKNKDQVVAEKREFESRFKGVDQEELEAFQRFQEQKQQNELLQLAADGKLDVLSHRFTSDLTSQFAKERAEYEDQLQVTQSKIQEYESMLEKEREDNIRMQKRGYLKELVGGDQSFLNEHFDKFYRLYGDSIDLDKDTGKVYALGDKGSRMVDTRTGDLLSYEDYYNREKAQTGIFWKGGAGSGIKTAGGDQAVGSDPTKWSKEEQIDFIQHNGQKKFSELLSKAKRNSK